MFRRTWFLKGMRDILIGFIHVTAKTHFLIIKSNCFCNYATGLKKGKKEKIHKRNFCMVMEICQIHFYTSEHLDNDCAPALSPPLPQAQYHQREPLNRKLHPFCLSEIHCVPTDRIICILSNCFAVLFQALVVNY